MKSMVLCSTQRQMHAASRMQKYLLSLSATMRRRVSSSSSTTTMAAQKNSYTNFFHRNVFQHLFSIFYLLVPMSLYHCLNNTQPNKKTRPNVLASQHMQFLIYHTTSNVQIILNLPSKILIKRLFKNMKIPLRYVQCI